MILLGALHCPSPLPPGMILLGIICELAFDVIFIVSISSYLVPWSGIR